MRLLRVGVGVLAAGASFACHLRPATAVASTIGATDDYVSVNASRGLDAASVVALEASFVRAGAHATTVEHQGTLDITSVVHANATTEATPPGSGFPMSTLAVDPGAIGATMGDDVHHTTQAGDLVMGETAARLHGVHVGDVVTMQGWNGNSQTLRVGTIAADVRISGAELVLSVTTAATLSFDRPFSVRAWGFAGRDAAASAGMGLAQQWQSQPIRVRYSWKDRLLDDTLPQSHVKELLGEFWVVRAGGGTVRIDPAWKRAHIVVKTLPLVGQIRCHMIVATAAAAALQELQDAGLGSLVDGSDSRLHGGCFSARETRSLVGTAGHNLSRHTWGGAIDINPSANPYGGPSHMDPRVITVFRRQGFVWGGSFLVPDPMHFEFVGQRHDAVCTPSGQNTSC